MKQINMQEAKTHLSMLVDLAAKGEPFIIAKAGKPMVKVIPYFTAQKTQRKTGFLKGRFDVPDDFDNMGKNEILTMFEGTS